MKKTILALMIMAAAVFTSCNKDDSAKGDATLIVTLPAHIKTRAVEGSVADATKAALLETDLVYVFLCNNAGTVLVFDEFLPGEITDGYKRIEQVPAATSNVLVVAKIPAADATTVAALDNFNAIRAYAYNLANQNITPTRAATDPPFTLVENKTIWGSSTNIYDVSPDPDAGGGHAPGTFDPDHLYKEVDILLESYTARFEVGTVYEGTGVASVELLGVWFNNFYLDNSQQFVLAPTAHKHFMADDVWKVKSTNAAHTASLTTYSPRNATPFTEYDGVPAYDVSATFNHQCLYNEADATVTQTSGSPVYAFHLFAGQTDDSKVGMPHLIVLVRGKYSDPDPLTGEDRYFIGYVTFDHYKLT
ncbi:MAG: hypothetical protein FWG54_02785, partial [Bacteroidetes bacterium]|nr:hypothetical protein [Bacteroidota bacterium]